MEKRSLPENLMAWHLKSNAPNEETRGGTWIYKGEQQHDDGSRILRERPFDGPGTPEQDPGARAGCDHRGGGRRSVGNRDLCQRGRRSRPLVPVDRSGHVSHDGGGGLPVREVGTGVGQGAV